MKVLIVEDNEDSRNLLTKQLSAYGHEVTAAVDGVDALEKALKSPPDILVTDILMPRMDGYKLCYEWKRNKQLKNIPFVFYTAIYTSGEDEKFALNLGANLFIRKPIEPEALARILAQAFEQAEAGLLPAAEAPPKPSLYLSEYNERLVAKLNEKVAELEKSEGELRYLGSVLRAIREINQLIVRERDKTRLLKGACQILRKVREYRFIWIGLIEAGHKRVVPVAHAGVGADYLDSVKITWDNRPSGQGPTGTAIKTGKPDLMKNIPENPRGARWRDEALKHGYRSSAAIPIAHDGKVYGALNVYSSHSDGFNKAEVELLGELSSDLGFALKAIEEEGKRQRAEEALGEAEQEKATILNSLSELVVFQDLEHQIIWANKAAGESVGMSPEKLVGQYCYEVWGERSEPCEGCSLTNVHQTGKPQSGEMTTPDGRVWHIRGYPVRGANGDMAGVVETALEITESKQAAEALRESEAFRSGLLANSPTPINVINPDSSMRYVNPALERLTGFSADELIGQKAPYPYWPKEDADKIMKGFRKAMRQGSDREEQLYRRKNGERFWVEITSTPVKEKGKPRYLLSSWVDITERKRAEEALLESEARYRALIEGAHDMVQSVGLDGSIIFVNKAWLDTLGYTEAELSGLNLFDVIHPDSQAHCRALMTEVVKGKPVQGIEAVFVTKDGRKVLVEGNAAPRYIGDRVVATQGIFRDVTERKRAEEKLRDEAIRHHILIDESSDGIVILDEKGKVYEANKRFAEMLGYSLEEARELSVWDWEVQYPREEVAEMIASVGPEGDHFETRHRRKDGTIYDVEISTNGAVYAGQKLVFCVCRDITARKQAEAALKESEEKYKTLVEATSDIIWEVDREGRFTLVGPRVKDVLGYEVAEVVGKKRTLDLIAKGERKKWLKRFKELSATKEPFFGLEITHLHKNGRRVIFETSGIPLFDSEGEFKGYVGINKDITERRHMQEQLVITDRLASVGELAAGIAHELNNPLTGVVGFSQLLMDKEIPKDIKQDVEVVFNEAQRASQVVKNLLTFARKHAAVKEKVNINDVIKKVLELRAYEQKLENITVDARLASELPEVMADYFQLQQVFLNIIINAEYFMKEAHHRGKLTITTEVVDGRVKASFADDGPGIAEDDLGHLFDPFFTTKEVGRGTGLGLSICHGIVAEHGGRIYVESELGKGATFIVELPIGAAERKGGAA